jgi:hypothetical protein
VTAGGCQFFRPDGRKKEKEKRRKGEEEKCSIPFSPCPLFPSSGEILVDKIRYL